MKTPKELAARYSYQFNARQISMSYSRGWFSILSKLCADIDQALGEDKRGFHWVQVKEKFGQLRVYFQLDPGVLERDSDLATQLMTLKVAAEVTSSKVCAVCGRPGSIDQNWGWMLALCEEHRQLILAGMAPTIWFDEDEL